MRHLLTCGLTLMLLTACGATDNQPTTAGSPPAPSPTSDVSDDSDNSDNTSNPCLDSAEQTPDDPGSDGEMTEQYLGLTKRAAEALATEQDHTIRVAGRDGECFALTMDYQDDRVNIYLEDDTVVAATRG